MSEDDVPLRSCRYDASPNEQMPHVPTILERMPVFSVYLIVLSVIFTIYLLFRKLTQVIHRKMTAASNTTADVG